MDRPKSISRRRVLAAGTAGIVGAAPRSPGRAPTKRRGRMCRPIRRRCRGRRERCRRTLALREPKRLSLTDRRTSSHTPLQDLEGIITPSDLHFERHHAGVPEIDPRAVPLLIHGMVERPLVFTLDDLKRFPASRSSARGVLGQRRPRLSPRRQPPEMTPQQIDGLTSTSEWTGVPLATLFREVGVSPKRRGSSPKAGTPR